MMPMTEMTKVLIVRSETGLGSITHVICVQDPNSLSSTSRVGVKLTDGYIGLNPYPRRVGELHIKYI